MKKLFIINVLLSTVIAVVACSKEENTVQETPEVPVSQTGPVSISANIPEKGLTKVSLTQDPSDADGVVKLSWNDSDVITVKNAADESKSVVFDYVSGAGSTSAVFSAADVSDLAGATSYNIYLTSGMPADFSNQDGSMGYSATLLGVNKYDGVTFSQTWAEAAANGSGSCVSSSILRIRAKMPSAAIASAVQAVIIKSDKNLFAGKDSIRIECTPEIDDDIISVYATLPAGPVSEATATKLLFQFQKSADKNDRLTAYREVGTLSFNDGSVNSFKISCTNIDKYAGTSDNGSLSTPYLVGDRNQLQYMNTLMGASEKYFKLIDDIKLSGFSWTPLNSEGTKVINLDGNGKRIYGINKALFYTFNGKVDNMTISGADIDVTNTNYGILGRQITVAGTHSVTDVHIIDSKIKSTGNTIGGFFGTISQDCAINGCSATDLVIEAGDGSEGGATVGGFVANISAGSLESISIAGSIDGRQTIGGVAGQSSVNMTDVSSSMNITSKNYYLGGLIGSMSSGTIDNCHATGNITQTGGSDYSHTGGLIGIMNGGVIQNGCYYSTGTVDVKGNNAGGLVGNMSGGTLDGCYSSASITTTKQKAGGLIGLLSNGTVQNCYASSSITTTGYYAGGLIGEYVPSDGNSHILQSCHATGAINTSTHYAGGLVGHLNNNVQIKKCYSTVDVLTTAGSTANHGGIVSHTDSAANLNIENCYYTGTMGTDTYKTRRWCGGILGHTVSGSTITVSNSYASFTVVSANIGLEGALVGKNESTSLTCTSFVGWSSLSKLYGQYNTVSTDGNYLGQEGTIYSQAAAFVAPNNWDFVNVWTTDATPLLR